MSLDMHNKKVLIIDDDADFLHLANLLFNREGAQVFTAHDGLDGLIKFFTHHPDLIILDIAMPGQNGFEVCHRMRQVSDIPIIIVTAINDEQGMLQGFESGADDFLSKPFNPLVLLARTKTVLRRNGHANSQPDSVQHPNGQLSIDIERREVVIRGERIYLPPVEFRLMCFLARHPGKVLAYEHILDHVWSNGKQKNVDIVHVYISYLRQKIETDPKDPHYILTVHGVGYLVDANIGFSPSEHTLPPA
jgi:DNA-binding response OmpR family regulator